MRWPALFRRRNALRATVTFQQVWDERPSIAAAPQLGPDELSAVHVNLLEFETKLAGEPQPLQALRCELMDSLDRQILNAEILDLPPELRARWRQQNNTMLQNDAAARKYLAANALRLEVLREYGSRRFGDRVEDDWFDVYEKAVRLRQRNTRNFISRTLQGAPTPTDEARFHTMTLMDSEIRLRLLQVPAGTRFSGLRKSTVSARAPEPDAST